MEESLEDKIYGEIVDIDRFDAWVTAEGKFVSRGNKEIGVYELVKFLTEFTNGDWDLEDAIRFLSTYNTRQKIEDLIETLKARLDPRPKMFKKQVQGIYVPCSYDQIKIWRSSCKSKHAFIIYPGGASLRHHYPSLKIELRQDLKRFTEAFIKSRTEIGGETPVEVLACAEWHSNNSFDKKPLTYWLR